MVKLIIVDDDAMDRQGLRSLRLWEELGIEVVGEAWNGKQALQLCLERSPDIVITDIRMPIMDGLAFTRVLKQEKPDIHIILLSGHEDFSAARQAVHIGAQAYLVKPIRRDELKEVLTQTIAALHGARIHHEEDEKLKKRLAALLPLERERFLHEVLIGVKHLSDPAAAREAEALGLADSMGYVTLVLIELKGDAPDANARRMDMLRAHDIIGQESAARGEYAPIVLSSDLYAVVLRPSTILNDDQLFSYVDGFTRTLLSRIREVTGLDVVIGVSLSADHLLSLNMQFEQAQYAVLNKALHGMNRTIWYESASGLDGSPAPQPALSIAAYVDGLVNRMLIDDRDGLLSLTDQFLSGPHADDGYIKSMSIAAVAHLATALERIGKEMRNAFSQGEIPYQAVLQEIMAAGSIKELKEYLVGLFVRIMDALFKRKRTKSKSLVEKAIEILNREYAQSLSAEELAKQLYVTPSHMRRLFKNQTGSTVQEYILALRMSKARELLFHDDLKVNEVASMVGYENNSYFCMIFKRYYGTTPTEYRNA